MSVGEIIFYDKIHTGIRETIDVLKDTSFFCGGCFIEERLRGYEIIDHCKMRLL